MGVEAQVEGLSADVTLTLPPSKMSVMVGPSGTAKSVSQVLGGLLSPEKAASSSPTPTSANAGKKRLYEIRRLFGVLFQDGALIRHQGHRR